MAEMARENRATKEHWATARQGRLDRPDPSQGHERARQPPIRGTVKNIFSPPREGRAPARPRPQRRAEDVAPYPRSRWTHGGVCAHRREGRAPARPPFAFSPEPPQTPIKQGRSSLLPLPLAPPPPPQPHPLSPRSPDLHVNSHHSQILSILLILSKLSLHVLPIYTAKNLRLPPLTRGGNYAIISVV